MKKLLVVVDMQNDFIDGALGTPEAVKILPAVCEKIRSFGGEIVFTKDTQKSLTRINIFIRIIYYRLLWR